MTINTVGAPVSTSRHTEPEHIDQEAVLIGKGKSYSWVVIVSRLVDLHRSPVDINIKIFHLYLPAVCAHTILSSTLQRNHITAHNLRPV